ncbi:MAG: RNB domain-containing ribonuclease [Pseudoclavibacter sp.]
MRGIRASALTFDEVRAEFELPTAFPDDVEAEADAATDRFADDRVDATGIPFVTIDPPGARDLDQALHVVATDAGFRLHYAIADVGAFVRPGSKLHDEAMRRGQTVYLPDGNVPLHPRSLSEDRASLLADAERPCVLWTIDTDANGRVTDFGVARARIRNRAQLDYATVQGMIDAGGELPEALTGLRAFGEARSRTSVERGAIELQLPSQDLAKTDDGSWLLRLEPRTAADEWNAECSLITGQCAAQLMIEGGAGLLRTLPAPDDETLTAFRQAAAALGIDWPAEQSPGALLASLPRDVRTLVLMSAATKLLRGSGYLAFHRGADEPNPAPEQRYHAGVAAEYAHATAPLRRLADRFASELCLAIAAGDEPDAALIEALDDVPGRMGDSSRVAGSVTNACIAAAEAVALQDRVGETFSAAVLRSPEGRAAEVFVVDPPVLADCTGTPPLGEPIEVRLAIADPDARKVEFAWPAGS